MTAIAGAATAMTTAINDDGPAECRPAVFFGYRPRPVAVVPDLHLLPVLCIVMLPAWLTLAGKPLMLVNRRQPPHDD